MKTRQKLDAKADCSHWSAGSVQTKRCTSGNNAFGDCPRSLMRVGEADDWRRVVAAEGPAAPGHVASAAVGGRAAEGAELRTKQPGRAWSSRRGGAGRGRGAAGGGGERGKPAAARHLFVCSGPWNKRGTLMDSLSAPRTPGVSLQLCRRLCPRQAAPRSARRPAAGPAPPRAPRGAEGERAVLWRTSPRSPSPPSGPRRSWAGKSHLLPAFPSLLFLPNLHRLFCSLLIGERQPGVSPERP